jgi:hypothetical protein
MTARLARVVRVVSRLCGGWLVDRASAQTCCLNVGRVVGHVELADVGSKADDPVELVEYVVADACLGDLR